MRVPAGDGSPYTESPNPGEWERNEAECGMPKMNIVHTCNKVSNARNFPERADFFSHRMGFEARLRMGDARASPRTGLYPDVPCASGRDAGPSRSERGPFRRRHRTFHRRHLWRACLSCPLRVQAESSAGGRSPAGAGGSAVTRTCAVSCDSARGAMDRSGYPNFRAASSASPAPMLPNKSPSTHRAAGNCAAIC